MSYGNKEAVLGKTFIAIQNGSFDEDDNLNDLGKMQMERIVPILQQVARECGLQFQVFCSNAPCAVQGLRILEEHLRTPGFHTDFHEVSFVGSRRTHEWRAVRDAVCKAVDEGGCVLLISHSDAVPLIARSVARRFGVKHDMIDSRGYGEGWKVSSEEVTPISQPT
jgi:phosphohistidine phosphatase SixA